MSCCQNTLVLSIPEANGINVFETMHEAGITLEQVKPNKVIKVMIIGAK